ncbi:hypothetical protein HZF08_15455 [Paenibacillus sp. CGMCC 1.16610]|uniref:HEAT repeat domain-containing protein n=1 Tax=Paenibacillus anseongense TaxID=2682845 RepID=A0ABW9UKX4_9BACL|nr:MULTISPECIES: hypothetical protein [Paenibacillus]MBA2939713.1 hypothetical protein [Paenibacillus sp. CGMCC 1.16610]MVQ39373.1 hypothetical protein [Paenibacillus anseongense]
MKGLSQTSQDRIDNIYKSHIGWELHSSEKEKLLTMIRLLGNSAEIAAVPYLIPLLLESNADLRSTAVIALESFIEEL